MHGSPSTSRPHRSPTGIAGRPLRVAIRAASPIRPAMRPERSAIRRRSLFRSSTGAGARARRRIDRCVTAAPSENQPAPSARTVRTIHAPTATAPTPRVPRTTGSAPGRRARRCATPAPKETASVPIARMEPTPKVAVRASAAVTPPPAAATAATSARRAPCSRAWAGSVPWWCARRGDGHGGAEVQMRECAVTVDVQMPAAPAQPPHEPQSEQQEHAAGHRLGQADQGGGRPESGQRKDDRGGHDGKGCAPHPSTGRHPAPPEDAAFGPRWLPRR